MGISNLLIKYRSAPIPVKAGIWFTLCSLIQRGISVISMPVFTRMLSTGQYGEYSLFLTWTTLVSLLITLNIFQEVFNKGLSDNPEKRDDYTSSQTGLLLLMAVLAVVVYLLFQDFVNGLLGMSTPLVVVLFLKVYSSAIVAFWSARKRFDYDYKILIAITLAIAFSSVLLGVVFVYVSPGDYKVFARAAADTVVPLCIAFVILFQTVRKSRKFFSRSWWKSSLLLSLPLLPHNLSQILLNQVDKMMIGTFVNAASVAIYSIAHSAGLFLVLVNNSINSSLVPWLYGRLREKNYDKVASVIASLCILVVAANSALIFLAPEIVLLLSTEEYIDAMWCIPPIATSVVFVFAYSVFVNVEIYFGDTKSAAIASVLAAVVNVILNLVAIPLFGYVSAAYTTAVSYLFTMLLHCWFVRKTLERNEVPVAILGLPRVFLCCAAIIAVSFLAILLYPFAIARYAVLVILTCLAFAFRRRIKKSFTQLKVGK